MPRVVAPSLNVTVPEGIPSPSVTVAVKVTDWPKVDGFKEEATPVVVAPLLTVTVALVFEVRIPDESVAVTVLLPIVLKSKLDKVAVPPLREMLPAVTSLSSAMIAFGSELEIVTLGVEAAVTFQLTSTALITMLLRSGVPAVRAVGEPVFPFTVPGAAVSPGNKICSLLALPGLIVSG